MAFITMASLTAPSTPEALNTAPTLQRRLTLPTKLTDPTRTLGRRREADPETVEILFTHRAGKIISFSLPSTSRPNSSSGATVGIEAVGTLPWASLTERTIAAGFFRIFRVPNSIAFLDSGKIVHSLFSKSQCWCLDGERIFVLRIRENVYYRIELPNSSVEDKHKAEELKKVFASVLQYELTPCPFKRDFTVDLPEPPKTPARRRPWTPKSRPSTLVDTQSPSLRDIEEDGLTLSDSGSIRSIDDEQSGHTSEGSGDVHISESKHIDTSAISALETPSRPRPVNSTRSITAPAQLTLKPRSPSTSVFPIPETTTKDADVPDNASIASSVDSFHSFHSTHSLMSPLPPSPPYSDLASSAPRSDTDLDLAIPRTRQHKREISELTVKASSVELEDDQDTPRWHVIEDPSTPVNPGTPDLTNDTASQGDEQWSDAITPSPTTALRQRSNGRRTHSPLPSPANLYTPRTRMTGQHLTSGILQKTCSLLLGPPIQLVALMLNIAAKIANGTFRAPSFTDGDNTLDVPYSWAYDGDGNAEDMWEEDDYGISLGAIAATRTRKPNVGGSWEID